MWMKCTQGTVSGKRVLTFARWKIWNLKLRKKSQSGREYDNFVGAKNGTDFHFVGFHQDHISTKYWILKLSIHIQISWDNCKSLWDIKGWTRPSKCCVTSLLTRIMPDSMTGFTLMAVFVCGKRLFASKVIFNIKVKMRTSFPSKSHQKLLKYVKLLKSIREHQKERQ